MIFFSIFDFIRFYRIFRTFIPENVETSNTSLNKFDLYERILLKFYDNCNLTVIASMPLF